MRSGAPRAEVARPQAGEHHSVDACRWPATLQLDTTADDVRVAIRDGGDAAVVWEHFGGDLRERRLFAATRSSKGSWLGLHRFRRAGGFSGDPDVGIDRAGDV